VSQKDWRTIATVGGILGLVVALHGVTSRRWQTAHTVATVLGVAAVVGPLIEW
jgi:hypothetical protein